jgi:hypothetical protein
MNSNADPTFALGMTAFFCLFAIIIAIVKWRSGKTGACVGAIIMALGFCLFAGNRTFLQLVPLNFELPIVRSKIDIALDKDGNIYVASENWRVQKYDKSGRFLFGIIPDDAGGYFGVTVTSDNELEVVSLRQRAADYFSSDGVYLRRVKLDQAVRKKIPPLRLIDESIQFKARFDRRRNVVVVEEIGSATSATTTQYAKSWQILLNPIFGWILCAIGMLVMHQYEPNRRSWGEMLRHPGKPTE